jgi:hypothetical protein
MLATCAAFLVLGRRKDKTVVKPDKECKKNPDKKEPKKKALGE